jgi:branched-chain amino acid transport system permease protein
MNWPQIFSNALYAAIGANAIGYCLAAIGLNVHFGYTGLLNFGQAGFALIGAYSIAVPVAGWGWNLWACIPLLIVNTAVFSLLLGIPTLKLRSDYLAIVTIAAAEILRLVVSTPRWTKSGPKFGGTDGINSFTDDFRSSIWFHGPSRFFKTPVTDYDWWVIIFGWALIAACSILVWSLIRSPWGRVLRSIREDEDAARSLGKNVFVYKMVSLMLGGVIGGLGGMMLAIGNQTANPITFRTELTFFAYAMVVLGGVGKVRGPIIGAMIFWFIISFTDNVLAASTDGRGFDLPTWMVQENNYSFVRFMLVGLGLALLVVFRPQGIFGDRREQAFDVR